MRWHNAHNLFCGVDFVPAPFPVAAPVDEGIRWPPRCQLNFVVACCTREPKDLPKRTPREELKEQQKTMEFDKEGRKDEKKERKNPDRRRYSGGNRREVPLDDRTKKTQKGKIMKTSVMGKYNHEIASRTEP